MDQESSAHSETALMREFLRDRAVACPVCAYNLRGSAGVHCPECGSRLDLRIGSIDLKLGPWLLGVFAIALPMGFFLVVTGIGLIGWKVSRFWTNQDWLVLGGAAAMTGLGAIGLRLLIKGRSRFLRLSRGAQWIRAWLLAAVMAAIQIASIIALNLYL